MAIVVRKAASKVVLLGLLGRWRRPDKGRLQYDCSKKVPANTLSLALNGVTDGARTRDLRDHNPNPQVLACPIPLEDSAYLGRICGFTLYVFPILFGSVLSLLLPLKLLVCSFARVVRSDNAPKVGFSATLGQEPEVELALV